MFTKKLRLRVGKEVLEWLLNDEEYKSVSYMESHPELFIRVDEFNWMRTKKIEYTMEEL